MCLHNLLSTCQGIGMTKSLQKCLMQIITISREHKMVVCGCEKWSTTMGKIINKSLAKAFCTIESQRDGWHRFPFSLTPYLQSYYLHVLLMNFRSTHFISVLEAPDCVKQYFNFNSL